MSARRRPRLLVDDLIVVDVTDVLGRRELRTHGTLESPRLPGFTVRYSREPTGAVRFTFPGGGSQVVEVVTQELSNGGWRRYFLMDGRLWRKLLLSPIEPRVVTRLSLGAVYRSASLGGRPRERLALRASRIERRLGVGGACGMRPPGMRSRRFLGLLARLRELGASGPVRQTKSATVAQTTPTPTTVEPTAARGPDRPSSAADELWSRMSWPSLRPRIIRHDVD
jgi:hypothetical protein